jgi:ATP-dependent DNA helicase RecG
MSEAKISDETGSVKIVWFNQAYIAKMIKENSLVRVCGKVSERKGLIYFSNPKIEMVSSVPIGVGQSLFGNTRDDHHLYPIYNESKGLSSQWIYQNIIKIFNTGFLEKIVDPIPKEILDKYNLPTLKSALIWIHTPKKESDAVMARKRFAFEEIFFIQLQKQLDKQKWQENNAFKIETNKKEFKEKMETFIKDFPFSPTNAQKNAINQIFYDFSKNYPMARLLEGDVGSGKTAVASAISFAIATSCTKESENQNLQVAYMAPTEILATQIFETFINFFKHNKISIGLLTGSGARKFPAKTKNKDGEETFTKISKAQLKKWISDGSIKVLIGTHALIQKTVEFKNLALCIIDEQHRFGTAQRQKLATKGEQTPHLLSMTATPIPRSLSLTLFGDLDLSVLDELPKGRLPVITEIVSPENRKNVYEKIKQEMRSGRQLYVICPRIDEPDPNLEKAILAKSVTEEAKRLQNEVFTDFKVSLIHGAMTPREKEEIMNDFLNKKSDVLVATSVIEVGVNVPNATMIIIEGAERFGLSQLHQLRGRVQRSSYQPYCFIFTESKSVKTVERLKAIKTAKNGFELAEFDLKQRGAGMLYTGKQWGVSDIAMEALKNIKMVEFAREEAKNIIEKDSELKKYPLLKDELNIRENKIHFE